MPAGGRREGAGRKPGVPNKSTYEVRDLLDAVFAKVDPVAKLVDLLSKPMDAGTEARVLLRLLEYRYGPPKQSIELTGADGGPIAHTIRFGDGKQPDEH